MSANPRRPFEFDPYKRPPAARLLAVLTIALLFAWMLSSGHTSEVAQFRRNPAKYAADMDKIAHHGLAFDIVVSLFSVAVVVFTVDGLTTLYGRWLKERELPGASHAPPEGPTSGRADALLGASPSAPPES